MSELFNAAECYCTATSGLLVLLVHLSLRSALGQNCSPKLPSRVWQSGSCPPRSRYGRRPTGCPIWPSGDNPLVTVLRTRSKLVEAEAELTHRSFERLSFVKAIDEVLREKSPFFARTKQSAKRFSSSAAPVIVRFCVTVVGIFVLRLLELHLDHAGRLSNRAAR